MSIISMVLVVVVALPECEGILTNLIPPTACCCTLIGLVTGSDCQCYAWWLLQYLHLAGPTLVPQLHPDAALASVAAAVSWFLVVTSVLNRCG